MDSPIEVVIDTSATFQDHIAVQVSTDSMSTPVTIGGNTTSSASPIGTNTTGVSSPASSRQQQQQQQRPNNNNNDNDEDDDLLRQAVQDAGRWAYGTVFVEVWVLNDNKTKLVRPSGGWWVDSAFATTVLLSQQQQGAAANNNVSNAGHSLLDPSSPHYIAPVEVSPGVGLAGALWSAAQPSSSSSASMSAATSSAFATARRAEEAFQQAAAAAGGQIHHLINQQQNQQQQNQQQQNQQQQQYISHNRPVAWRDLVALSKDPDQPYDKRVKLMVQCGLGWAAAVAFENNRQQGIVIYVARQTTNRNKLQSTSNEAYLQSASDLIGSAYALRGPRRVAVSDRQNELVEAIKRARTKLLALKHMGMDLSTLVESHEHDDNNKLQQQPQDDDGDDDDKKTSSSALISCAKYGQRLVQNVTNKAKTLWNKCKGGNVPAPPAFTWEQTLITFCGAFLTLLMITRLNVYVLNEYGKEYAIVLGAPGAVVTLLYGLTAAPASQPRNIILGQAISMTIALSLAYWDFESEAIYVRQALATSAAVGAMVYLGVTHPPAGASAFVFSSGQYHWGNMAFMIVANIIAVGSATIINNLSDKRQYPTSWGFRPLVEMMTTKKVEDDDDDDDADLKKTK